MDHGNSRQHSDHPEHGSHPVEKRSDDQKHEAFGTFQKSNAALTNQRLRAGARIADHDRADHDQRCKNNIEEAIAARVENQKPEEERGVAVTVDDRIEESAEASDLV